MNWLAFAIAAWVALGLELGFADALQLGDQMDITPSFVTILIAYACLWSSPAAGVVGALALGVAMDLTISVPTASGREVCVLGPHALGAMLAGYTVVTLRALMFRKNVMSLGFLALIAAALLGLVVTALLKARSIYDELLVDPALPALGQALASAVYTGGVALLVAPVLNLIRPLFDFEQARRGAFRIQ